MAHDESPVFSTETIMAAIKEYGRSEFSIVYAHFVKNVRYVVLVGLLLVAISVAAVLGLGLVVFGVLVRWGVSLNVLALAAIIMGALALMAAVWLVFTALSQRFWIKTFQLDKMVAEVRQKAKAAELNAPVRQKDRFHEEMSAALPPPKPLEVGP